MKKMLEEFQGKTTGEKLVILVIFFLFILTIYPRFINILNFLPYTGIDENDITEVAVMMTGENLNPHFFKYGPVFAYILTAIYKFSSLFVSGPSSRFYQDIFFNPTYFYYVSRFVNGLLIIFSSLIAFKIGEKFFNKRIAYIALAISIFPFSDYLTNFKARLDVLLGLWGIFLVYFCLSYCQKETKKNAFLMGLFFGLSIATKPLPGFFINLPLVVFTLFFSVEKLPKLNKLFIINCFKNIFKINSLLVLVAAFFSNLIFSPYTFLDFDSFWREQIFAFSYEKTRTSFTSAWEILLDLGFGLPFTILLSLAFLYCLYAFWKKKELKYFIVLCIPLTFCIVFFNTPSRGYWFASILPLILFSISIFLVEILEKTNRFSSQKKSVLLTIIILIIFAYPSYKIFQQCYYQNSGKPVNIHSQIAATKWIEENISTKDKIFLSGCFSSLPRIVANDVETQAKMGEYFMYWRWKNKYYNNLFFLAYNRYKNTHPTYPIVHLRGLANIGQKQLCNELLTGDFKYAITASKLNDLYFGKYLIKEFTGFPNGDKLWIYKFYKINENLTRK